MIIFVFSYKILTKLTSEELKAVVPKKVLLPKTVVILPGNTIFIGGMGRLDYLEVRRLNISWPSIGGNRVVLSG